MAIQNPQALYSDLNQYTPQLKPLLFNIESIYQSIYNILTTSVGSRLFNRDFGCDLEQLNFDLLDFVTIQLASYIIFNAIEASEPRVSISSESQIIPDFTNHLLELSLVFQVSGLSGQTFSLQASLST